MKTYAERRFETALQLLRGIWIEYEDRLYRAKEGTPREWAEWEDLAIEQAVRLAEKLIKRCAAKEHHSNGRGSASEDNRNGHG